MIKYFFCFILIFFLRSNESLFARAPGDSLAIDTAKTSYTTEESDDSAGEMETLSDSQWLPVPAGNYKFSDTVRHVSLVQVRSYTLNPDYVYANDPGYWKKEKPHEPGTFLKFLRSPLLRWAVLLVVIALVMLGIYQLIKENSFGWLLRKPKLRDSGAADSLPDEELDYEEAIRKYQGEGNYRLAVRYMYLRLISKVREHSEFQIRDSSTNAEIVRAFVSHPSGNEFSFLTRAYEYIFYGGFLPKEELYATLKIRFDALQQKLSV